MSNKEEKVRELFSPLPGTSRERKQVNGGRSDGGKEYANIKQMSLSSFSYLIALRKAVNMFLCIYFILCTPKVQGTPRNRGAKSRFVCAEYSLNKSYAFLPWGSCLPSDVMCSFEYMYSDTPSISGELYGKCIIIASV